MNVNHVILAVVSTVFVSFFGILLGLFFQGIDRILVARMQARIGPPLSQPFIDTLKLMCKQNIVPANAIPWLFQAAPVLALASSVCILLYIPLGPLAPLFNAYGDLVLVMYLLVIPALALVVGGFASGSPYATIGAQREMVTMIAYELPLAAIVIAFAWKFSHMGLEHPFSLATAAANPIWAHVGPMGFIGAILLLVALLLVTPGELSRIPFDTPEAETELAGGLLVEYSGRNLALFNLSFGVKTIVMTSLVVALFCPYSISRWVSLPPVALWAADGVFLLVKMLVVMFVAVSLIRAAVARFRINHVVDIYWKYVGAIAVAGMFLVMLDSWMAVR